MFCHLNCWWHMCDIVACQLMAIGHHGQTGRLVLSHVEEGPKTDIVHAPTHRLSMEVPTVAVMQKKHRLVEISNTHVQVSVEKCREICLYMCLTVYYHCVTEHAFKFFLSLSRCVHVFDNFKSMSHCICFIVLNQCLIDWQSCTWKFGLWLRQCVFIFDTAVFNCNLM